MEEFMREALGDELADAVIAARSRLGSDVTVEIAEGAYNIVRRKPNSPDRPVKMGLSTASDAIAFLRDMKK